MKGKQSIIALIALAGFGAFAGSAFAQDQPPPSSTPHHDMGMHHDMANMSGMHDMPATVTNVDHKTGVVDVESMSMKLKVHFPANTVADLKNGDKITLHLGFSKQG